jgi:hypothetical protein
VGTYKYAKTRFVIASEAKQSRVFAKNYGRFADAATPVALYAVKVVVPRRYAPRNDIEAIFRGSLEMILRSLEGTRRVTFPAIPISSKPPSR